MAYEDKTRKELATIAKERGIKYLTYMKIDKIIEMLQANDKDPSITVDPEAKAKSFAAYDKWRRDPKNRERYLELHKRCHYRVRGLPKRLRREMVKAFEG